MILNEYGKSFEYEGIAYTIGEQIAANEQSEYEGLVGVIVEIRDGDDKETENDTPDIYCSFDEPLLSEDIAEIERRFSELYGEEKSFEEIALDYVAMAPEMIFSTSEKRINQNLIAVYVLTEDWANNGEQGHSTGYFAGHNEALREFKLRLGIEANNGIIAELSHNNDFVEDIDSDAYECYINDIHCECHYKMHIEKKNLCVSDAFLEMIANLKISEARIHDFILQIEDWDEVAALTEEQFKKLISDPNIADEIGSALTANDSFDDAYWMSVSEVAHRLVDDFIKEASK